MNLPAEPADTSRSPLVSPSDLAAYGYDLPVPRLHTDAELQAVIGLLTGSKPRIETVVIGHGRDDASSTSALAFATAWQARDGRVLTVVDWPELAASWLRPANRLTAETPDAWVVAAGIPGFAQLARRLRHSTAWDPARTVAFAALADSRLTALAGADTVEGLRGATAEGGTWDVRGGWVTSYPPGAVSG
jgi:hypothetical protein